MLVYQRVSSIETYVHPPSATSGYAAIGEDLVAGVDAAERRKVFSRVGAGGLDVIAIFRKGNQWGTKKSFQDITISLCFLSFFKYMGESGNPWGSKRTSMGKSLGNQWMYIRLFLSTGSWCGPFWDIPYLWNMWLIRCECVYNTYMWKYYSSINFCDIICIYCRKWVELTTLKQIWDSCTATSLV